MTSPLATSRLWQDVSPGDTLHPEACRVPLASFEPSLLGSDTSLSSDTPLTSADSPQISLGSHDDVNIDPPGASATPAFIAPRRSKSHGEVRDTKGVTVGVAPRASRSYDVGAGGQTAKPFARIVVKTSSGLISSCLGNTRKSLSRSSSSEFCRICHDGASKASLISPCQCSGTMGGVHRACLETWLQVTNHTRCEICSVQFITARRVQPLSSWLRQGGRDRRVLLGDAACFLAVTPLVAVSLWLCITGALHFTEEVGLASWETVGLLLLSSSLVVIYTVWIVIAVRYHTRTYHAWSKRNQIVRLVGVVQDNPAVAPHRRDERQQDYVDPESGLDVLSSGHRSRSPDANNNESYVSSLYNGSLAILPSRYVSDPDWRPEVADPGPGWSGLDRTDSPYVARCHLCAACQCAGLPLGGATAQVSAPGLPFGGATAHAGAPCLPLGDATAYASAPGLPLGGATAAASVFQRDETDVRSPLSSQTALIRTTSPLYHPSLWARAGVRAAGDRPGSGRLSPPTVLGETAV